MSFFKARVSSSLNFASFSSIMASSSSVLWLKQYIFEKSSTWKCKFSDMLLLALKFIKFFMSFLEPRVSFSSNFASLFSVIRRNSSVLFHLKPYILWTKGAHQSAYFGFRLFAWNLTKLRHFLIHELVLHELVHPSVSWQTIPINDLAETLYALDKKSPSKYNFSDFWVL